MKDLVPIDDIFATTKSSPAADAASQKKANQIDNAIMVLNQREKLNWTQQVLADRAHVSIDDIIAIEDCTNDNEQALDQVKQALNQRIATVRTQ